MEKLQEDYFLRILDIAYPHSLGNVRDIMAVVNRLGIKVTSTDKATALKGGMLNVEEFFEIIS